MNALNMRSRTYLSGFFLPLMAGCALAVLRLYGLQDADLADYDSTQNFLLIRQLVNGDFGGLYHHASPTFYLLYAVAGWWRSDIFGLMCLNTLIQLVGLWVWVLVLRRMLDLGPGWQVPAWVYAGLGTFYVYAGRYVSIEALSLLGMALVWYCRLRGDKTWTMLSWLIFGILGTVDYKAVLSLPFLVFWAWMQEGPDWWRRMWPVMVAPAFYTLAGVWTHGDLLIYLRHLYVVAVVKDVNPVVDVPRWQEDWLFYLRCLTRLENALLLPGLGYWIWSFRRFGWKGFICSVIKKLEHPFFTQTSSSLPKPSPSLPPSVLLALYILGMLGGLSLLQKAPRGLLYLYVMISVTGLYGWGQLLKRPAAQLLLAVAGLCWQALLIYEHTWPGRHPSVYALAAKEIQALHIHKIALATGIQITPFLRSETQWRVVFTHEDWQKARAEGYQYLLDDPYRQAAGLPLIPATDTLLVCHSWTIPQKPSAYLSLENAEFAGKGWEEMLNRFDPDTLPIMVLKKIIPPIME